MIMQTKKDKQFDWIFYASLKIGEICQKNRWPFFFEVSRERDFGKGAKARRQERIFKKR
jgi:hypothetical protein